MSCIENDLLEERAFEIFQERLWSDGDFYEFMSEHFCRHKNLWTTYRMFDYLLEKDYDRMVRDPVECAYFYGEK